MNSHVIQITKTTVVLCFAIIGITLAYYSWAEHKIEFDDSFISYRYAYNLVHGDGLVFNSGEYVEGYTNFSWVLLSALCLWLGKDPAFVMPLFGFMAFALSVLVFVVYSTMTDRTRMLGLLLSLLMLPLFFYPKEQVFISGAGLESAFYALILFVYGLTLPFSVSGRVFQTIVFVGLGILAFLTRMDGALASVAGTLVVLLEIIGHSNGRSRIIKRALTAFGVTLALALAYLFWKYTYYGSVLPNTYYAKGANEWNFQVGFNYLEGFFRSHIYLVSLFPFAIIAFLDSFKSSVFERFFNRYAFIMCLLYLIYLSKVGGDFMDYRMAYHVYPIYLALCFSGLHIVCSRISCVVSIVSLLCALPFAFSDDRVIPTGWGMQSVSEMDKYAKEGKQVGQKLGEVLPKDTVLGATLVGTLSYYSKLPIVDQWGLNHSYVIDMPQPKEFARGHVKRATLEYQKERGVNLYIAHPYLCPCDRLCVEDLPNVFIPLGNNVCLRSWYFTPTRELTKFFCSNPDKFILHNIEC